MSRTIGRHGLACLLGLTALAGCAGNAARDDAAQVSPTAAAARPAGTSPPVLSVQDRCSFFVDSARKGRLAEVTSGLDTGIPVNGFDTLDETALIAAIAAGHADVAHLLVERGANVNLADHSGWTPLHFAAYFDANAEVFDLLLAHGASINAQNDRGVTALYLAAASGHEATVRRLLAHGADPAIASRTGFTPLRIAKTRGLERIVAVLAPVSPPVTESAQGTH